MRPGLGHLEPSPERDRPCGLFLAVTTRIRAGTSDTEPQQAGARLLWSLCPFTAVASASASLQP